MLAGTNHDAVADFRVMEFRVMGRGDFGSGKNIWNIMSPPIEFGTLVVGDIIYF